MNPLRIAWTYLCWAQNWYHDISFLSRIAARQRSVDSSMSADKHVSRNIVEVIPIVFCQHVKSQIKLAGTLKRSK